MGKILGLDYGTKRVGIAETDDLQIIASPLTTIHSNEVVDFIKNYKLKNELESIVMGDPRNLDGSPTDSTHLVKSFAKLLKKNFPDLVIHFVDERFTSKMASVSMIESGVKKSKRHEKGTIDKVSAALILKTYLEQKGH